MTAPGSVRWREPQHWRGCGAPSTVAAAPSRITSPLGSPLSSPHSRGADPRQGRQRVAKALGQSASLSSLDVHGALSGLRTVVSARGAGFECGPLRAQDEGTVPRALRRARSSASCGVAAANRVDGGNSGAASPTAMPLRCVAAVPRAPSTTGHRLLSPHATSPPPLLPPSLSQSTRGNIRVVRRSGGGLLADGPDERTGCACSLRQSGMLQLASPASAAPGASPAARASPLAARQHVPHHESRTSAAPPRRSLFPV